MTPLIVTENLSKNYAGSKALDNLCMQVHAGEIVGLLGPNGAGKTTAIHILLGLLSPTSGHVSVFGLSPMRHRHLIAERLNLSSAYTQLPSNLRVRENLTIFSKLYNVKNPKKKIEELMETFSITGISHRITGALSAGEKTRLNLCKCLLNDPELLLLDEPTASLDPEMADETRRLLKAIQRRKNLGILFTSHNMPEVEELCGRIYFIHEGKTITQGTPSDIIRDFKSKSLEQVFIKIVRSGDFVIKSEGGTP